MHIFSLFLSQHLPFTLHNILGTPFALPNNAINNYNL